MRAKFCISPIISIWVRMNSFSGHPIWVVLDDGNHRVILQLSFLLIGEWREPSSKKLNLPGTTGCTRCSSKLSAYKIFNPWSPIQGKNTHPDPKDLPGSTETSQRVCDVGVSHPIWGRTGDSNEARQTRPNSPSSSFRIEVEGWSVQAGVNKSLELISVKQPLTG